jgi:predicted PurR-regulated permease PerM
MSIEPALSRRNLVIVSGVLAAVALWLVLYLHLLPALLAGLLVYELVVTLAPPLQRWIPGDRARWLVVLLLTVVVVGLLILLVLGILSFLHDELGNPQDFWQNQAMPLVDKARTQLPPWIVNHLPDSVEGLRLTAMDWLRAHAGTVQLAGKEVARVLVHILIGLVLGAIVALGHARPTRRRGPLALILSLRCKRLGDAFHNIVFAQVKISLLNTVFTAIFLLLVLPLFGVHLPLAKTLVLVTFIVGLLPVIGNLISNTVITVVALSISLGTGIAALAFLVAIHKLEYFLNARILGTQIRARAWELLVAMLVMEAAFGLPGVIAAPIFYAYLKSELEAAKLI